MRHTYTSRRERLVDFWAAFAGWFLINIVAVALLQWVSADHPTRGAILSTLVVLGNVALPVALAFIRAYAALGILIAFSSALLLAVIEGVFYTASDFAGGEVSGFGGPPTGNVVVTYAFLVAGFIVTAVVVFFIIRAVHRGTK